MLVKEALYQVFVDETRTGRRVAVGPCVASAIASEFCATIRREIAAGREKDWSNPSVTLVKPLH